MLRELTDPVVVLSKGRDISQGLAIGSIEGLDADSSGQKLAVVGELEIQLGTELLEQDEVVGRVSWAVGVAGGSSAVGVLPVNVETVHVPAIGGVGVVREGVVADKDQGVVDEGLAQSSISSDGGESLGSSPATDRHQDWDAVLVTALDQSLDVVTIVVAVKEDVGGFGVPLGSDTETAVLQSGRRGQMLVSIAAHGDDLTSKREWMYRGTLMFTY